MKAQHANHVCFHKMTNAIQKKRVDVMHVDNYADVLITLYRYSSCVDEVFICSCLYDCVQVPMIEFMLMTVLTTGLAC